MNLFQWNNVNGKLELGIPETFLIPEFKALLDDERNKCKEDPKGTYKLRAFKEFAYIWLMLDWQSIIENLQEQDRHQEAMRDSGLTKKEFDDPTFRAACRKYREIQDSNRVIRMLHASENAVDKFTDHFNNIDPDERVEGKPIYKLKDLMADVGELGKVNAGLLLLQEQVKKQLASKTELRGGATDGYQPMNL